MAQNSTLPHAWEVFRKTRGGLEDVDAGDAKEELLLFNEIQPLLLDMYRNIEALPTTLRDSFRKLVPQVLPDPRLTVPKYQEPTHRLVLAKEYINTLRRLSAVIVGLGKPGELWRLVKENLPVFDTICRANDDLRYARDVEYEVREYMNKVLAPVGIAALQKYDLATADETLELANWFSASNKNSMHWEAFMHEVRQDQKIIEKVAWPLRVFLERILKEVVLHLTHDMVTSDIQRQDQHDVLLCIDRLAQAFYDASYEEASKNLQLLTDKFPSRPQLRNLWELFLRGVFRYKEGNVITLKMWDELDLNLHLGISDFLSGTEVKEIVSTRNLIIEAADNRVGVFAKKLLDVGDAFWVVAPVGSQVSVQFGDEPKRTVYTLQHPMLRVSVLGYIRKQVVTLTITVDGFTYSYVVHVMIEGTKEPA